MNFLIGLKPTKPISKTKSHSNPRRNGFPATTEEPKAMPYLFGPNDDEDEDEDEDENEDEE